MNFLAHLLLAQDDPAARLGCLYPDLAPPRERRGHRSWPEPMRRAIAQHLAIDAFTDLHPVVARSKRCFRGPGSMGGRLSGVLVDLFYDHILARNWQRHHPRPLSEFIAQVHRDLLLDIHRFPSTLRDPLERLVTENWLGCYASAEGLAHVLTLMSRRFSQRLGRPVALQEALPELVRHDARITADFEEFFPQLRRACPARPPLPAAPAPL